MSIVPNAEVSAAPPASPPAAADEASPPPVHPIDEAIARLKARTPEEIMAARSQILARSPPPHPIPPGKTWIDMVVGQWPGDETDEEIEEWLRKRKGG